MRHWKIIGAVVAILGEGVLQMTGYTSLPLAAALGVVIVVLLMWSVWPSMKRIRFQRPIKMRGHTPSISDNKPIPLPQSNEPVSLIPSHNYIADAYIRGRIIYLMDLLAPSSEPIISDRTIEDCEVRGPAMVGLLGNVIITDSGFEGDIDSLFVEIADNRRIYGAIGLRRSTFRRCQFKAIGILGTKEQIQKLKQGFSRLASHKEGSQTE